LKKVSQVQPLTSAFHHLFKKECPLDYYPRPYFERGSFVNLNGEWEFAKVKGNGRRILTDDNIAWPGEYPQKIIVPYAVETVASGINEPVLADDLLWYRKSFNIQIEPEKRYYLNFEKVDQECRVYLNRHLIGLHGGGYTAFQLEMTSQLIEGENILEVLVQDLTEDGDYPTGKQRRDRGGIWYTATSGIYDTVWYEVVAQEHLEDVKIETVIESKKVMFELKTTSTLSDYSIDIYSPKQELIVTLSNQNSYTLERILLWSGDNPSLYTAIVKYKNDEVKTYFSFRNVSKGEYLSDKYLFLNNSPVTLNGVLDQGYYAESGLTPLCYEEMMSDLELVVNLKFNTIRKHIKIESRRFYYECDRLGIYLIQDLVSLPIQNHPFYFGIFPYLGIDCSEKKIKKINKINADRKANFEQEMKDTVKQLSMHPSILVWTLFNEAWGQHDTKAYYEQLKKLDSTRLIDVTSGWYDRKLGDFDSVHRYFLAYKGHPHRHQEQRRNRILSLSEFGGYTLGMTEHLGSTQIAGYAKFKNTKELSNEYQKLYLSQIIPSQKQGTSIFIYTQLSDVEDEMNGLITFDRKVTKVDEDVIRHANEKIRSFLPRHDADNVG
jgi:beta-galactosidase/beta-glucuronidase